MQTVEEDVLVVRHSRLALAVAGAPLVLGAVLALGGLSERGVRPTGLPELVGLGLALTWIGLGGLLYAWACNPGCAEKPARARCDGRGLFLDGALAVAASRVSGGWIQPQPQGPPVLHVLARPGVHVALVVRDIACARDLLDALSANAVRAPTRFLAFARPLGGLRELRSLAPAGCLLGLLVASGLVLGNAAPLAVALAAVALIALLGSLAVPTRVTVGADGVLLAWLGTEHFVSWSRVAAVEPFDGGVVLALAGGRWLTLRTPASHQRHHPEGAAMIECIRAAWRASASSEPDEAAERLLRRHGGRTREWVREMRGVLRREYGYRCGAMPPERLWRVVEDAGAEATARVGAAVALAASLDGTGRCRLREAADACVEPRVRVALATAATTDGARMPDEDLAAALDAIDPAFTGGAPGASARWRSQGG
jgi:hypothetical protein